MAGGNIFAVADDQGSEKCGFFARSVFSQERSEEEFAAFSAASISAHAIDNSSLCRRSRFSWAKRYSLTFGAGLRSIICLGFKPSTGIRSSGTQPGWWSWNSSWNS